MKTETKEKLKKVVIGAGATIGVCGVSVLAYKFGIKHGRDEGMGFTMACVDTDVQAMQEISGFYMSKLPVETAKKVRVKVVNNINNTLKYIRKKES